MNFTESFSEFSSRLTTTDLALYAGLGLILFVLFKDRLSPVQKLVLDLMQKSKGLLNKPKTATVETATVPLPVVVTSTNTTLASTVDSKEDLFFKLVVSWKQTRDLAQESGCAEAVKVADQMFPFLSPMVCGKNVSVPGVVKNEQTN
jgi:hypothetical protein